MSLLSIKIDRVAAIRQIGKFKEPDPGHAAVLAEVAGADGVTCRLREDRLYIRDRDIYILKEVVKSKLTVQIAPGEDLIDRVIEVKPYMVTLVPFITEDPEENRWVDLSNQTRTGNATGDHSLLTCRGKFSISENSIRQHCHFST